LYIVDIFWRVPLPVFAKKFDLKLSSEFWYLVTVFLGYFSRFYCILVRNRWQHWLWC